MKDDIAKKLRAHLAQPVDTECGVVYLLAGVRKILEQDRPDPKPFALWMYCHWALHVNLSNTNTTKHFLEQIDTYISHTVADLTPTGSLTIQDEDRLFREFVYLDGFRDQLREFLTSYDLPTAVCTGDKQWFAFIAAYAKIIEDGELSCNAKKGNGVTVIEKVTFKVGNPLGAENHLPFKIIWDIQLKDRRMLRVELDAIETLVMSCHLELIPSPS
jgi:hypothetical protein